ncbi:hypothetical protein JCM8097_000852 [Rhodosporidiobolus ruineniae]
MSPVRLPVTPPAGSPLLGDEAYTVPRPRRRVSRSLVVLVPLALLAVILASQSSLTALIATEAETVPSDASRSSPPLVEAVAIQHPPEPPPVKESKATGRVRWTKEEQQLRIYKWTTPEVHESLKRRLEELSPAQRRTRDWLLRTRTASTSATGIGLGALDPPRPIQPAPPAEQHINPPGADEGPGLFVGGSQPKYSDLVQEWKTGRPLDVCEGGTWQQEYAELHADMLSGKREPRLLEFVCRDGDYCGGIADRLLGMVTTFLYSVITKRAVSMTWEQPAPLDLLFDSPNVDWSRPFNASSTLADHAPYSDTALFAQREEINAHNWFDKQIDKFFPSFVDDYGGENGTTWLQLNFNRGVVIRSFSYPSIRPHLDRLGLKLETAYSCLINYLLRPKPAVLAFIHQYTSLFSLPEYFVIGLQVRTGDTSMYATRKDAVNTVKHHQPYFRCAAQVASTYAHPSQKVLLYLITDSRVLEADALEAFDHVVVTGLKPAHVEIKTGKEEGFKAVKRAADGFLRTVAEQWIFASTDFQILTYRSGFGKIPTWLRGRPNSTIQLFNPHMDPVFNRYYKKKHRGKLPPPVDCSKPEALKSFSDMAQDWSLG